MFELYTEKARRAIFFARYAASRHPSDKIQPEHLLLGILREFPALRLRVPVQDLSKHLAQKFTGPKISTSVDLQLADESKRALGRAAKEAERLGHKQIECGHLALGVMLESRFAGGWLGERGIGPEAIEKMIEAPGGGSV